MKRRNSSNISKAVAVAVEESGNSQNDSGNGGNVGGGKGLGGGSSSMDTKILDWSCEFLFKHGMEDAAMEIIFESKSCAGFKDSTLLAHFEEYLKMKRKQLTGKSSPIDFVEKEWEIAIYVLLRLGKKRERGQALEKFSSSMNALFLIIVYNLYSCTLPNNPDEDGSIYTDEEAAEALGNIIKMFGRESVFLEDSELFKVAFVVSNTRKGLVALVKPHFDKAQGCVGDSFLALFTYVDTLKKGLSSIKDDNSQLFLEVIYRDINNGLYAPSDLGMDDMKMLGGRMPTPRKSPRKNSSFVDEEKRRKKKMEEEEKERARMEKEEEERKRMEKEEEERKRKEIEREEEERKRKEMVEMEMERMRMEKEEGERKKRKMEEEERKKREMEEEERKRKKMAEMEMEMEKKKNEMDDDEDEDEVENDDDDDGEDSIIKLIRMRKAPKYSLLDIKRAFPSPTKGGWDSIARQTDKDIIEFKGKMPRIRGDDNSDIEDENGTDDLTPDQVSDKEDGENDAQKSVDTSKIQSQNQSQKSGLSAKTSTTKSPVGKSGVRRPFTQEEEAYLLEGVKTFGEGKWSLILESYPFVNRTNVNLKDKWRNMQKKASREKEQEILRIASEATKRKYPHAAAPPPQKKARNENVRRVIMKENDDDIYSDDE